MSFDVHGDTHSTADAQRRETFFHVALLHGVEQCRDYTCARRSNRRAKCDCAAMNIYLLGVPAEVFVERARLCRESLIGFGKVEIVRAPPASSNVFWEAGIGPEPMIAGSTPTVAQETIRASASTLRFFAPSADIWTIAAAPSLMP